MQRQFPVFALHGLTFKNARPVFFARMCAILKKTEKGGGGIMMHFHPGSVYRRFYKMIKIDVRAMEPYSIQMSVFS